MVLFIKKAKKKKTFLFNLVRFGRFGGFVWIILIFYFNKFLIFEGRLTNMNRHQKQKDANNNVYRHLKIN